MAGTILLDDTPTLLATQADFTTWGDWTIVHYSGGPGLGAVPKVYKPGVSYATIAAAPVDAITFLKKNNQLFAIGHGTSRRSVSASDADDIEDWTPTASNASILLTLEDFDSAIVAGCHLGPNIAVYGDDQLALVYWIGRPDYWGRRMALDGIGAVGKKAVCADGPLNYGVSRNGCWRTDGNTFQYIDQGVLHDYLEDNVNWDQKTKILAVRNDVTHCIEFHFPMGSATENDEAWAYDPATGGWGEVTPYQSMQERKLYEDCLAAIGDTVYLLSADATVTAALDLSTKPLLMQTPQGAALHEGSYIDEVEILTKLASNVEFRYGVSEDSDGTYSWTAWITLVVDLTTYSFRPSASGTFHKLEFRSTAANWAIDLQGFVFYGTTEGTKRPTI